MKFNFQSDDRFENILSNIQKKILAKLSLAKVN